MHYQSVKRKLPEPNVEVIGFNKEWVSDDNPDGTRLSMLYYDNQPLLGLSTIWLTLRFDNTNNSLGYVANRDKPTHWCSKPIPPITLK